MFQSVSNEKGNELEQALSQYKNRIERFLTQSLNAADINEVDLKNAMEYSLLFGGKRLRPFLVYATGELFNASLNDLDAPAAALEAIHSYSLIHDDLPAMDDDNLRRGKPTCHIKYGEAGAILAGDTLQSFAFNIIASHTYSNVCPSRVVKLICILSQAANDMCAGQAIDLKQTDTLNSDALSNQEKNTKLNALKHMHSLKTGALIKASIQMGAICGNANDKELELLTEYADAIGLAFQVWDDVLDITSDTETLGKPQGSDLEANKTTYPALLGLEATKQKAASLVKQAINALTQLPYNTAVLEQLANYIIERDH